jgi:hypothetical protein
VKLARMVADPRVVVLVEGASDAAAVAALATRCGVDLADDGIEVVAIGGATNIARALARFGPGGEGLHVAGLCDAGEERAYRRGLERGGFGADLDRAGIEAIGFFVCEADLEDELLRALGVEAVEAILEREGELASFRRMQLQPAQRGRSVDQQLRRFIGTRSGRKIRYGRLLVEALDPSAVPAPLARLLDHVLRVAALPLPG